LPPFKLPIYGTIVWAEIVDQNGVNPKTRPMIVIDPPESDSPDATMEVVVISGSVPPDDELPLHVKMNTGPNSPLPKNCWAVCQWTEIISVGMIDDSRRRGHATKEIWLIEEVFRKMDEQT